MQAITIPWLGGLLVLVLSIVIFFLRNWIERRIQYSVKNHYEKNLLEFKNKQEIRLKAELVADLFAEWLRDEKEIDYYRLNLLSFQAFLWLPSHIASELSKVLSHQTNGNVDVRTVLFQIRNHLLENEKEGDAKLTKNEIITFTKKSDQAQP
jgi:uncharacterized protein YehS (DUF1456 family)